MAAPAHAIHKVEIVEAFSYGWRKLMETPAPWLIVATARANRVEDHGDEVCGNHQLRGWPIEP